MTPLFRNILVPVDFSALSDAALEQAKLLAAPLDASVHVIHVVEERYAAGLWPVEVYTAGTPQTFELLVREAEKRMTGLFTEDERRQFRATTDVLVGPPAHTIVDEAAHLGADLIVMGTHGRSGVAHMMIGSVAEKVVRSAPCPVLVVRVPAKAAERPAEAAVAAIG